MTRRDKVLLLLSHHPTRERHRTILLAKDVRICARCTGIAFGLIAAVWIAPDFVGPTFRHLAVLIATLPAVVDWTTQALEWRESRNWLRLATGSTFGLGMGWVVRTLIDGHLSDATIALAIAAVPCGLALFALKFSGAADRMIIALEEDARLLHS